jgi:hypothetical protein
MPNIRVQNFGASLKVIYVDNTDLTRGKRFTYLGSDVASGASSIPVQSIIGFESLTTSSGQIVCIGEIGLEKSEILRTSNSTAPTGTTVTLRDTLLFDHPQDTKVYIVDWSRVEFDYAGTATGTKSTLTAYPLNIQADLAETQYRETAKDSVFYFARFNDSIDSRNSNWSDPIFTGGYDDNMVFSIKQRALDSTNEVIDGQIITHEFLNSALWEARREYHNLPGKRPFRRVFNADIGDVDTGIYRVVAPADLQNAQTAENVYGVRIGANQNMTYYDKKSWDFDYRNRPHTTLSVAYNTGARDLYVASARDFNESGVVSIGGTNVSYSEKSNTGGTLRISADGLWNSANGSDVWQNISYGLPTKFTVWMEPAGSAYIYFNTPIDTAYVGQNIYLDYYRTLVGYDSDADTLDEPEYDMYVPYLAWKIKKRKNSGLVALEDDDFKRWELKKANAYAREYIGTEIRMIPDVGHLPLNEEYR